MNQKILRTAMGLVMLACVYLTVYVCLPRYKNTSVMNNEVETIDGEEKQINLSEKKIVIDSGHGGIDPGKESANGILEKDINLGIAFRLKSKLEEDGIAVIMTRTDENGLYQESDSNKKIADMKKRCSIIEESNADAVISIHQNSFQSSSVKGAQVFYYKHSAKGKILAQIIQKSFKEYLDESNVRVEKPDTTYYMLVHTKIPTVIAECGFLSNPQETALLVTPEYQDKVALALYNGIVEYLKNNN